MSALIATGLRFGRSLIVKGRRTVETPLVCHVIYQQYSHRSSVICSGDCAESFLAGGIPYLQLHSLAIQFDSSYLEVDADGGDEGRGEGVFAKPQQAAGLAYAAVAYEE